MTLEDPPALDGSDCVECGRCCHHPPQTVQLHENDEARLTSEELARLTVIHPRPPHFRFIVNDEDRCGALDVSVPGRYPCGIYERRPDGCRTVEPGSPCCLEARKLGRLGTSVKFTVSRD